MIVEQEANDFSQSRIGQQMDAIAGSSDFSPSYFIGNRYFIVQKIVVPVLQHQGSSRHKRLLAQIAELIPEDVEAET